MRRYINLGQEESSRIERVFHRAADAAHDDVASGHGAILVCCADGTNRSVAVAIVVVMAMRGCPLAEAWETVSKAHVS